MNTKYRTPRRTLSASALLLATTFGAIGLAMPDSWAGPRSKKPCPEIAEFSAARFIFELNSTGEDMGAQLFLDGEPWKHVMIFTPTWRKLVDLQTNGNVKLLGLTELFAETHEPAFDEMTPEQFLALFPEGEYKFFGQTTEGTWLAALVPVTHDIPKPTTILAPSPDGVVSLDEPVVVRWTKVPDPRPPESVIIGYEVIVEKVIEGQRLRVLDVEVLPDRTSLTVPPEFLEPGTHYFVEVLPIETNANQTITEGSFNTAG